MKNKENILNIPNLITFIRLLFIPVFIYYLMQDQINIAILIFIALIASDKLDGVSARITNQVTEFGRNFDAAVDWILNTSALIIGIVKNLISAEVAMLFAIPIIMLLIIRSLHYIKKRDTPVPSLPSGKISVGLVYITIILICLKFQYAPLVMYLALFFLYYAIIRYTIIFLLGKDLLLTSSQNSSGKKQVPRTKAHT